MPSDYTKLFIVFDLPMDLGPITVMLYLEQNAWIIASWTFVDSGFIIKVGCYPRYL